MATGRWRQCVHINLSGVRKEFWSQKETAASGKKTMENSLWLGMAPHNGGGVANGTKCNDAHYKPCQEFMLLLVSRQWSLSHEF